MLHWKTTGRGPIRAVKQSVGQTVIEVQIVGRTADDAPASISSPDGQLYGRRDDPTPTRMGSWRSSKVFLSFDSDEPEI
jgi:hypothetical protein